MGNAVMVLLGYIVGIIVIVLCMRRRREGLRSAVLLGYNFLFVAAISFSLLYTPGLSGPELIRVMLLSIYQAHRGSGPVPPVFQ